MDQSLLRSDARGYCPNRRRPSGIANDDQPGHTSGYLGQFPRVTHAFPLQVHSFWLNQAAKRLRTKREPSPSRRPATAVFVRRDGGRLLLKARGAAKSRHAHCSPELWRNKVGSLTTDRHHTFQFRPAHAELLDERRVRFDGPSANRFEHLIHPIWGIHPFGHSPIMPVASTGVFAPRAGGVAPHRLGKKRPRRMSQSAHELERATRRSRRPGPSRRTKRSGVSAGSGGDTLGGASEARDPPRSDDEIHDSRQPLVTPLRHS